MAAQWIHDKARRVGVPRELEHHVVHLVLAHHGKLEYGSPKVPMTLEALLTHYIDEIDSRVNSWLNLMGREGGNRRWTDANNVYEQPIWRGALPTVQAEKKGPPARGDDPGHLRAARPGGGQSQGAPKRKQEKKPRPAAAPAPRAQAGREAAEAGAEAAPAGGAPPGPSGPSAPTVRPIAASAARSGARATRRRATPARASPATRVRAARPDDQKSLTHSPFAALAAKLGEPRPSQAEAPPRSPLRPRLTRRGRRAGCTSRRAGRRPAHRRDRRPSSPGPARWALPTAPC